MKAIEDEARRILKQNPGLESFLRSSIGQEFLKLSQADLKQLSFYSGLIRETDVV